MISFVFFETCWVTTLYWCHIKWMWVACGSLATFLMCLAVVLELSIFLANCLNLLAGNLFKSMLLSLMVFNTNSSSLRKNQNICSLCLYSIVPFIHTSITLSKACKQVKSSSYLIRLGLAKFFNSFLYDI